MVRGPGFCASMWPQGGEWSQGAKALQCSHCLLCHFRTTRFKRPMPIIGNDKKPLCQDNLEGAHLTDTSLRGRKGCDPSICLHPWSQSHCYWKQLPMRHPALNEAACVPVATPSLDQCYLFHLLFECGEHLTAFGKSVLELLELLCV